MARPHDKSELPKHPAIGAKYKTMLRYGAMTPCGRLTCPECKTQRWLPLYTLRQYFRRGDRFTGHCRKCKSPQIQAGHQMWLTKMSYGRNVISNGYRELSRSVIESADLPMFLAMCPPSRKHVLEHRWNMAKHLGRPLLSSECIDHMDGDKLNNSIDNLRIYVRGKNHPGSANGHGTYYHEWQMALARIKELEAR